MKATELLTERATSVLYHYTNSSAALKILRTKKFELSSVFGSVEEKYAPKGYPYFLSCTRTLTGGYHEYVGGAAVMFNIDGDWYNQNYKAGPVDYWGNRNPQQSYGKAHEAEDRIFSRTPQIPIAGVTAIHVYAKPMDEKDRKNYGASEPARVRQLLIAAKTQGIKAFLYEDEDAWRKQDTRKAIHDLMNRETLRGPEKIASGLRMTSWMEPWLELIYKNTKESLTKKANQLSYNVATSQDYWISETVKGLANDMSNARKANAGPDREVAIKLITYMKKNKLNNMTEFVMMLRNKWAKIYNDAWEKESAARAAANPVKEGLEIRPKMRGEQFALAAYHNSLPIGHYEYDGRSGRSVVELDPEMRGKGYGKVLVLSAIHTANVNGIPFYLDDTRTADFDNVVDSLLDNGLAVDDGEELFCTQDGADWLKGVMAS